MPISSKGTDSRDYIIPFRIFGEADLPFDIPLPPEMPREFSGIFLPQDGAAPAQHRSPPCVLLLAGPAIWFINQQGDHKVIPLARLDVVECARMLLLGWIGLEWDGGSETIRYNRRSAPIVERFLQELKTCWLRRAVWPDQTPRGFGIELNAKFRHVASIELLADEAPRLEFFQPPVRHAWRSFGLRRETHKAGDLLILSDRRLLWITDKRQSVQDRYGTVARSAPLAALQQISASCENGAAIIEIGFGFGARWSVPAGKEREDEAKAFAEMAGRAIGACPNQT